MTKDEIKDLGARAGWTFSQTFLAIVTAAGLGWVDINVIDTAFMSGIAAVLSGLKTFAMSKRGLES